MKLRQVHVAHTVYGFRTCVDQVKLLLRHEDTHNTCGLYRVWFQHMCKSRFSTIKLHTIHAVQGFGVEQEKPPLSRGLPALRMTPWASTCSPSPDTRVTSANSLALPRFLTTHKTVSIPFMVPGHVTHQATLKLEHIASKRTCDPYPAWFQGM